MFVEDVFESDFEKCLCNNSRLYKNAYKVLVLKIVQRDVCYGRCFLKVIFEKCLCNNSRLYKNTYKVF